ncbi:MAG: oligosaccharide flippase family protein [Actinomycetia bacterium]|nr:oligosaccharide flippase family protein [Actinomycetes bacterium]
MNHPSDDRMTQNATALVMSSMISSALGLLFWGVAARVLPTNDVGSGTAIVTSIVLLGNLATIGLRNGLIRFMSSSGRNAGHFITSSYLLCATVALFIAVGFAYGTPWWARDLTILRHDRLAGLAFAAGTVVWTLFILQDSVLIGLRRAIWVPIENIVYSVVKLVLLIGLLATGAWALPLSWCIPALVLIVPVNLLVFGRLMPGQEHGTDGAAFTPMAIARFSIGDFGADMIRLLGAEVVVLVVLGMRGVEDTAYVFFAITIASSGQLVTNNIVTAFVAESAARPAFGVELARRAGVNIARLIVPGALIGALAAPILLGALGSDYADNGTSLLRLLMLDSIPLAVAALAAGWARFQQAAGSMVAISLGAAAAPLCGAVLLAPPFGVDAIGWSALVGHAVLAALLLTTILRPVISASDRSGRDDSAAPTGDRHLDTAISWLVTRRGVLRQQRRARIVATMLDELDVTRQDQPPLEPRWLVPSDNDTAIVKVEHPLAHRIVKVALSDAAARSLLRHGEALVDLHAQAAGTTVDMMVPTLIETGECAGHRFVVESVCPGQPALAADHSSLVAIAAAVERVHHLTTATRYVDDAATLDLVGDPIATLASDPRLRSRHDSLDRLGALLRGALAGRRLVVARTHGDCWTGNAMVETAPGFVEVTGLIDWEDSRAQGVPDTDFAHLWLAAQGEHIGRTTAAAIRADDPVPIFADLGVHPPNPHLPLDVTVLLAWLGHVTAGLSRVSRFGLGRFWLTNNVDPVLDVTREFDPSRWDERRLPQSLEKTGGAETDA